METPATERADHELKQAIFKRLYQLYPPPYFRRQSLGTGERCGTAIAYVCPHGGLARDTPVSDSMKLADLLAYLNNAKRPTPSDPFGPEAHKQGAPTHSNEHGHYCLEWDGLWICDDCEESMCCHCFEGK